jgi:hypothetical protein
MIDACHKKGLAVIIYYKTNYYDWYWENHPEARIVDANGQSPRLLMNQPGTPRRFSLICMNNPAYKKFIVTQLEELCENYDFEGVWPDMDFWPTVCYCRSCKRRYREETGGEIPKIIDWEDPEWVKFQRKRQQWLCELLHLITSTIKSKKPEVSVSHQSHTFYDDWMIGGSAEQTSEMDWLGADIYVERYTQSLYAKLFHGLSEKKPFELIEGWCYPNIHEHIVTRTEDELRLNTFAALINNAAMTFIDAVDPKGRLHEQRYRMLGRIYGDMEKFETYAGGDFCQDIAIYYSYNSNFDLADNGKAVIEAGYNFEYGKKPSSPNCHRNAAVNLAKTLVQNNIPYGAITKKSLADLSKYQIVALPNVVMLDQEEIEALRAYVQNGGNLYASKNTSIISIDGVRQDDFLLSDVFGVSYIGQSKEVVTYVVPEEKHRDLFPGFTRDFPISLYDSQLKIRLNPGAKTLATLTLPYTDPTETRWTSLLTNPPGIPTPYPSIVENRYGKGRVIYSAGVLEIWDHDTQRTVLLEILKSLATRQFFFESDAPKSVEITMFHQKANKRYIINLLNYQRELPNIPISDIALSVWLPDKKVKKLQFVPGGEAVPFTESEGCISFTVPQLKNFAMLEFQYT